MNKRNNKILINVVSIGNELLKIGVREPKVPNIYNTLARWCYIKRFIGIDVSCMFRNDRVSLISCNLAIFLLIF